MFKIGKKKYPMKHYLFLFFRAQWQCVSGGIKCYGLNFAYRQHLVPEWKLSVKCKISWCLLHLLGISMTPSLLTDLKHYITPNYISPTITFRLILIEQIRWKLNSFQYSCFCKVFRFSFTKRRHASLRPCGFSTWWKLALELYSSLMPFTLLYLTQHNL